MAHAERFDDTNDGGGTLAAQSGLTGIRHSSTDWPNPLSQSADIETATACEERAQRLALRLSEVEDSIRLSRMYLSASRAIEDILLDTRRLLEKGRTLPDPASRKALSDTFAEIKRQVGDIVAEAGHDGRNLAAGDVLRLAFDEDDSHFYEVGACALSSEALGLAGPDRSFESESDIIAAIMEAEHAINAVRTRHTVVEMALSVLEGRARFGRDRIQSLRNTSRLLLAEDKAYGAVCGIAARRLRMSSEPSAAANHPIVPAKAEAAIDSRRAAALEGESPDEIAKDLARLLRRESYLTNWFKFEAGDTAIFTRLLAQNYGPDLIKASRDRYTGDKDFRSVADSYMAAFERRIEAEAQGKRDREAAIDRLLKTDQGTVYVILSRARNRM